MAQEVGVGYIRLVPSMKGFGAAASKEIDNALTGPAKKSGEDAGQKLSTGVGDGVKSGKGKISGASEKVGEWFKTGLVAVGVAAGALLVGGVAQALDTETATAKLAAQLGGSDWAKGMGEVAGNLYLDGFGESAADTGAALKGVLQNGLLPEDATNAQIEDLTGRLMTFTDVMEQDMDMSTQAVSNMLRTGLAESGTEALDILTRGVQQGADRAGDLAEVFQEYSTMFRDVGLSGLEATGLMSQGLQAGARDADTVADALKEFAIRAQDGSETSKQGFKDIGLNAAEMTAAVAEGGPRAREALDKVLDGLRGMEDPAERNAAAVALFGTKAEDLGDALFALDLDTAAQGMGDVEGATDDLGSAYETNAAKIEGFKRKAMDKLADVVSNEVIPAVEGLGAWAKENPEKFKTIAAVVGGLLVVAFAAWAVSAASAAVATIAATWPVLAIGAAVALLAALVVTHWDTIVGFFNGVREKAGAALGWVRDNWPKLLLILTGPFGLAVVLIRAHWDKIKSGATAVKDWVIARLGDLVSWVRGLPGRVASAVDGLWDGLVDQFYGAINAIIRGWNNLSFTIGGGSYDPLGRFGPTVSVPSFTFNTPNIPTLHTGGIFNSGGSGGEGLALLKNGEGVFTPDQMRAMGNIPAHTSRANRLEIDLTGGDGEFMRWLRGRILAAAGGNVQRALGAS